MNKEEIRAKLHNYEERLKDIAKAIEEVREQLAELDEKPKLQLGDFGITTRESVDKLDKFVVIEAPKGNLETLYQNGQTDGYGYVKKHPEDYTILGNVFDLMKGWSEPFEEYKKVSDKFNGRIEFRLKSDKNGVVYSFGDAPENIIWFEEKCGYFSISEAEEIHNALGHAIAELKRKENK